MIDEQDVIETLTVIIEEPENGDTTQHKWDREAYDAWKKKNSKTRVILLSAMADDITKEFKIYEKAIDL